MRVVLVSPNPVNLGPAHEVFRNKKGRICGVRCPSLECQRIVYVNFRSRIVRHNTEFGSGPVCALSGMVVRDDA